MHFFCKCSQESVARILVCVLTSCAVTHIVAAIQPMSHTHTQTHHRALKLSRRNCSAAVSIRTHCQQLTSNKLHTTANSLTAQYQVSRAQYCNGADLESQGELDRYVWPHCNLGTVLAREDCA